MPSKRMHNILLTLRNPKIYHLVFKSNNILFISNPLVVVSRACSQQTNAEIALFRHIFTFPHEVPVTLDCLKQIMLARFRCHPGTRGKPLEAEIEDLSVFEQTNGIQFPGCTFDLPDFWTRFVKHCGAVYKVLLSFLSTSEQEFQIGDYWKSREIHSCVALSSPPGTHSCVALSSPPGTILLRLSYRCPDKIVLAYNRGSSIEYMPIEPEQLLNCLPGLKIMGRNGQIRKVAIPKRTREEGYIEPYQLLNQLFISANYQQFNPVSCFFLNPFSILKRIRTACMRSNKIL